MTGVHITRMPDRIAVTKSIPDLDAAAGDVILRYMYLGEGTANIWIKGHWYQGYDCTFVTEDQKNGGGCQKDCSAVVKEYGVKEWWVKVQTADGKVGWVLADDNFDGMDSLALLNPQSPPKFIFDNYSSVRIFPGLNRLQRHYIGYFLRFRKQVTIPVAE